MSNGRDGKNGFWGAVATNVGAIFVTPIRSCALSPTHKSQMRTFRKRFNAPSSFRLLSFDPKAKVKPDVVTLTGDVGHLTAQQGTDQDAQYTICFQRVKNSASVLA